MAKLANIPSPPNSWQTEQDVRTLCDAQKIQKDPKRLKAAMKLAQQQIEDLEGLAPDEDKDEKTE